MTRQVEHLTTKCLQQAEKLCVVVFIGYVMAYHSQKVSAGFCKINETEIELCFDAVVVCCFFCL